MIKQLNGHINVEEYINELNKNKLQKIMPQISNQITVLDYELAKVGLFQLDRKMDNWLIFLPQRTLNQI